MEKVTHYSEWLTPERFREEERLWEEEGMHEEYAFYIRDFIRLRKMHKPHVLEFGCGTGRVAKFFTPIEIDYRGIDNNKLCIEKAPSNALCWHPDCFILSDIREFPVNIFQHEPRIISQVDIVCAFAFLKHFSPDEFPEIMKLFLMHGKYGMFTMPVAIDARYDFNQGFPHIWVTLDQLTEAVAGAGHRILHRGIITGGESVVYTQQKEI